ncbi:7694_t:CDS:2 [Funneliformis caledonium]|uniref:7694_t:CDS:1 n=1 Tax=Funneliformis caledonium TaxID=1117310 RepID=A0A9N9HB63_9GLOM|nr:7694_t:CDS:2 [Funneliformis caledonium]
MNRHNNRKICINLSKASKPIDAYPLQCSQYTDAEKVNPRLSKNHMLKDYVSPDDDVLVEETPPF